MSLPDSRFQFGIGRIVTGKSDQSKPLTVYEARKFIPLGFEEAILNRLR
jgi:hypothetical protein